MTPSSATRITPGARACHAALALGSLLAGAAAQAGPILPPPGVASDRFDDFYRYSTRVLDYLQPSVDWSAHGGTGQLDVIITTRSSGQTNGGTLLAPYAMPDPVTNSNADRIDDQWGESPGMRVADLYRYLRRNFSANVPTFAFDMNETGGNPDLRLGLRVDIVDGPGGAVLHTWAMDGVENSASLTDSGVYDPDALVAMPGISCAPGGSPCFDNNVGSGKFDFLLFAPEMNLGPWADSDNLLRVAWQLRDVDDGGEELTIAGRFSPDPPGVDETPVPLPATLALGVIGALAGGAGRAARARRP
jgi:hypothetical protein